MDKFKKLIKEALTPDYLKEDIEGYLNDREEMKNHPDLELLIRAVEDGMGIEVEDWLGSGSYNGTEGWYLRTPSVQVWKDNAIESLKRAFDKANMKTQNFTFTVHDTDDYEREYDDDRSWDAAFSFFSEPKSLDEANVSWSTLHKDMEEKRRKKLDLPNQEDVDEFFRETQNEMHYLNSKPVAGQKGDRVRSEIEPWDEYDLSNWNALLKKAGLYYDDEEGMTDYMRRRRESDDYLEEDESLNEYDNFDYYIFSNDVYSDDPEVIYYDAYLDAGPKEEMIKLAKQYSQKNPDDKFIVAHAEDWHDEVWSSTEPINEDSDYDAYALKMYGKKWDDLGKFEQTEVVDAVEGNFTLDQIKPVNEMHDRQFPDVEQWEDAQLKKINEIDINDPVLMKARAAKMADEKEKSKQAELDKKYGKSFMDKLEAEIVLKQQLGDLKDEREQIMIDMEQEAEPEGGEIADEYGSRLNDIDSRMELIQKDIDDLRMYESVNEEDRATRVDKMMSGEYDDEDYKDSKRYDDVRDEVNEALSKSAIKKQIKIIDKQIDTETGGDGEPLTDETLQALEKERKRLEKMLKKEINEAKLQRGDKITIEFDDEDGDYKAGDYTIIDGKKGGKELEGMGIKIFMTDKELNSIEYTVNESNWEKKLSKKAVWVDDDLIKLFKDNLGSNQWRYFIKTLDKAEKGLELSQTEEKVVQYFNMVKANWDDAIAKGMSPDEISLNPNKPIEEVSRLEVEKLDNRVLLSILDNIDSIDRKLNSAEMDLLSSITREMDRREKMEDAELAEDINLNVDDEKDNAIADEEEAHSGVIGENEEEKLSIMKDENNKFIIGMATEKHPRSKEAGPFNSQQEACKFFSEKEEVLLKNLTENNRLDEFAVNKFEIVGDAYSACAINENKEFNFKQLVKEALTPHYLK